MKLTKKEEWDAYKEAKERHEQFIKNYRFFLDRVCNYLDFIKPDNSWTTIEIRDIVSDEIRKSSSMDAPNEPRYYRANND